MQVLNHVIHCHASSKEWAVFVHGAGGNISTWKRQVDDFKKKMNLLFVDLRGHGDNKSMFFDGDYSFDLVTQDVINLLDQLKIRKANFVGLSMGTIIIRVIEKKRTDLVNSMILCGAILKLNKRLGFLIRVGKLIRYLLPYSLLYKLFALIKIGRAHV